MIHLTSQSQILLATKPADFRRGMDGFIALCRQQLLLNPRNGKFFVFINRRHTMLRVLCYDGTGFWLMTKRLSKGCFLAWPSEQKDITSIAAKHFKALVIGAPDWQKL